MEQEETPRGQFGLVQLLLLVGMPAMGILGFQFGWHWGFWQGVGAAILGVLATFPLVGLLFFLLFGLAWLKDLLFRRKP